MNLGEIFNLRLYDIQERNLTIQPATNGRAGEVIHVPQKLPATHTNSIYPTEQFS